MQPLWTPQLGLISIQGKPYTPALSGHTQSTMSALDTLPDDRPALPQGYPLGM